jgi:hypothetical protein
MLGKPPVPISHDLHLYDFSVPPWRLAELLWPNFSGQPLPTHRRWLAAAGGERDFWVPSLYMGLLPLLLAAGSWRLRGGEPRTQWLSWMVLVGVFGALGSYGFGWLLRQAVSIVTPVPSSQFPVGGQVGGLYWLFTVLLPGYVQFRFPGKLMVIAALGLSGLASREWDRTMSGQPAGILRRLLWAGVLSLAGLMLAACCWPWWESWFAGARPDPYFGPLQARAAYGDLLRSLAHAVAACAVFWLLLRRVARPADGAAARPAGAGALLLLALVAIDVGTANGWMIITAPANYWHGVPYGAQALEDAESGQEPGNRSTPLRLFRGSELTPPAWAESSSPDRMAEVVLWERGTLLPSYHFGPRMTHARAAGTMMLRDYETFLSPARREDGALVRPRRALDAWGTAYFLVPHNSDPRDPDGSTEGLRRQWAEPRWSPDHPQGVPTGPPLEPLTLNAAPWPAAWQHDLEVLRNESRLPRGWIVHDLLPIAPVASQHRARVQAMMQPIVFPFDRWLDLRRTAMIEDADLARQIPAGRLAPEAASQEEESCRVTHYDPLHVEIEATLSAPGVVVLSDVYYPGWQLDVISPHGPQPMTILRTNRLMRGALLPAGTHRLVYRYRPGWFYIGAAVSTGAWLSGLCLLGLFSARRRRSARAASHTP